MIFRIILEKQSKLLCFEGTGSFVIWNSSQEIQEMKYR